MDDTARMEGDCSAGGTGQGGERSGSSSIEIKIYTTDSAPGCWLEAQPIDRDIGEMEGRDVRFHHLVLSPTRRSKRGLLAGEPERTAPCVGEKCAARNCW